MKSEYIIHASRGYSLRPSVSMNRPSTWALSFCYCSVLSSEFESFHQQSYYDGSWRSKMSGSLLQCRLESIFSGHLFSVL